MSIHYPDNTASRTSLPASGIGTDSSLIFDAVYGGTEKSVSLNELKKVGYNAINVRQYGAVLDGTTDDTAELQAALNAASGQAVLIDGPCYITDTVTVGTSGILMGVGKGRIITPSGWGNKPALTIAGSGAIVDSISITETNYNPASHVNYSECAGIRVTGNDVKLINCSAKGFVFPFQIYQCNRTTLLNCTTSHGYAWGLEIDSVEDCTVINHTTHTNGWHGCKIQNEYSYLCDGLKIDGYLAYNNGQRSIQAGGSEADSNGIGISFYNGGYRFILNNAVCHDNYGGGFSAKGGGVSEVQQGEGLISNCQFYANKSSATVSHGVELGVAGALGGSYNLHFSNINCSNNTGDGFQIGGAVGCTFVGCTANSNGDTGFKLYNAYDCTLVGGNFLSNEIFGIRVGYEQSGTQVIKRLNIKDCVVSGNWDSTLSIDPTGITTAKKTEYVIAIYSDTANTIVEGCRFYNPSGDNGFVISGNKTIVRDCTFINFNRQAVYVNALDTLIDGCMTINTDFTSSTYYGDYYVGVGASARILNSMALHSSSTPVNSRGFMSNGILYARDLSSTNVDYLFLRDGVGTIISHQTGSGAPAIYSSPGSIYQRTDGGTPCFYVKESGHTGSGWTAK